MRSINYRWSKNCLSVFEKKEVRGDATAVDIELFWKGKKKIKGVGIGNVHIKANQRGKGLGTELMRRFINSPRIKNKNILSLFTLKRGLAHRMYLRLGFVDLYSWDSAIKILDFEKLFQKNIRRSLKNALGEGLLEKKEYNKPYMLEFQVNPYKPLWVSGKGKDISFRKTKASTIIKTDIATMAKIWSGQINIHEAEQIGLLSIAGTRGNFNRMAQMLFPGIKI